MNLLRPADILRRVDRTLWKAIFGSASYMRLRPPLAKRLRILTRLPLQLASPSHCKRPVFIVGAPRSETTLLFRLLSASPHLGSLKRESHWIWEFMHPPRLAPDYSQVIRADDVTPRRCAVTCAVATGPLSVSSGSLINLRLTRFGSMPLGRFSRTRSFSSLREMDLTASTLSLIRGAVPSLRDLRSRTRLTSKVMTERNGNTSCSRDGKSMRTDDSKRSAVMNGNRQTTFCLKRPPAFQPRQ